MRCILVAMLTLLLSACAPRFAPPGPGPAVPHLTETHFQASDGLPLAMRKWLPTGSPRAVVLAVHGFNDYSKAFDVAPGTPGVGPYLAERGVAVYAYDQRGFGASPYWGLWPGRDAMIRDFKDFAAVLQNMYPGVPFYPLGESMGGAVVMTALAEPDAPKVAGTVLVAPAVWGRSTMPVFYRAALWLGSRILPGFKPSGESLGRLASDNLEALRANGRDPLFIKRTRIDSVYGLTGLMDEALASAPKIAGTPVLYLYGQNDQIIPKGPTREAIAAMGKADAGLHPAFYEKGWHMILRDKQASVVMADIAAFLENPQEALPSGADVMAVQRLAAAKN